MKKLFILFLFSYTISITCFSIFKTELEQQEDAKRWVEKYLSQGSEHDIQMVANLLYWSYKRSDINLKTQESLLENLESIFKCWQNISATRLNPSHSCPNNLCLNNIKSVNDSFLNCYLEYKYTGESYVNCTETVLKKSVLENSIVKDGVIELRKSARWVMAKSLIAAGFLVKSANISGVYEDILTRDHKLPSWLLSPFDLGIKTFVQLDSDYNKTVTTCQNALLKAQVGSNLIWKTIETSRSIFYKDHYNAIMNFMKAKKFKDSNFNILFSCVSSDSKLPESL